MHVHWTDIELEEHWFLEDCERQTLLPGKSQGQRLAIAALLKLGVREQWQEQCKKHNRL